MRDWIVDRAMLLFVVFFPFIAVACFGEKPVQPNPLIEPISTFLKAHEPLHLDQLQALLELTEKKPPTIESTAEALQEMVKSGEVVISTKPNNPKWRPLTIILWDDVNHEQPEEEGVR